MALAPAFTTKRMTAENLLSACETTTNVSVVSGTERPRTVGLAQRKGRGSLEEKCAVIPESPSPLPTSCTRFALRTGERVVNFKLLPSRPYFSLPSLNSDHPSTFHGFSSVARCDEFYFDPRNFSVIAPCRVFACSATRGNL